MVATLLASAALLGSGSGGCTGPATERVVRAFVADYDAGRVTAALRLVAPAPRFQWLSVGARLGRRTGRDAYDRSTLGAYLRGRVRAHEHIRLLKLGAGYDPRRKLVDFGGSLVRSADGLPPGWHPFKGAADCVSGVPRLIVWSM